MQESYGARSVSGFVDAPGRRDDIVAYADIFPQCILMPRCLNMADLYIVPFWLLKVSGVDLFVSMVLD